MCLACIWSIYSDVGPGTEGGHCQGACHPYWFFYVPLKVSEMAPPFTWSCDPQEIHSLQCCRARNKSPQASPATDLKPKAARMTDVHATSALLPPWQRWGSSSCVTQLGNFFCNQTTSTVKLGFFFSSKPVAPSNSHWMITESCIPVLDAEKILRQLGLWGLWRVESESYTGQTLPICSGFCLAAVCVKSLVLTGKWIDLNEEKP